MGVYGVYTAVDDETFKQISFLNKEAYSWGLLTRVRRRKGRLALLR